MKNSGNEAKKCLKTNDITFSSAANITLFARKSTQNVLSKEQNLGKRTETYESQMVAGTATMSRLHSSAVTPGGCS
jgi:hypothetical protein